ncbi:thymidylate synthase [Patescibacteria group bacterium]|nr:thymidylate synthase [Patescibacteria group bacterium]
MKPYGDRTPDTQYRDRLRQILDTGVRVSQTPQGIGAITCFGELPPMVFDLDNGAPLITERKIGFWRKPIAEIIAFINGVRTLDELSAYGCDFWEDYRGRGSSLGLEPDDLGPGSYGGAFHDFPMPDGGSFNQFEHVIEQIKNYPSIRTHLVSPWIPYYIGRGGHQKAIVSPCHGWLHFRVFGEKLSMRMDQRSADFPIGVPSNMIQYAALLLMVAKVTGLQPWKFIHTFADAHIYENQIEKVKEIIDWDEKNKTGREPRRLPTLQLNSDATDLSTFRSDDFEVEDYDPHPKMKIPYAP